LAAEGYQGQRGEIVQVQCRTLDSIAEELNLEPDFLKIDVEGFEDAVLSGAHTVLRKSRPRIVLEANPGDPCDPVAAILEIHGYKVQSITGAGPKPRNALVPDEAYRNWLCLP